MKASKTFQPGKLSVVIAAVVLLMPMSWTMNDELPYAQADAIVESQNVVLSQAERVAIVQEANHAIIQFFRIELKDRKGNEIPQHLWGDVIRKLKPLRVENDRANVAIVLQDDDKAQEGLYVSVPISSYSPLHDKRFSVFEKLSQPEDKSFGELYHYRMEKKNTDSNR